MDQFLYFRRFLILLTAFVGISSCSCTGLTPHRKLCVVGFRSDVKAYLYLKVNVSIRRGVERVSAVLLTWAAPLSRQPVGSCGLVDQGSTTNPAASETRAPSQTLATSSLCFQGTCHVLELLLPSVYRHLLSPLGSPGCSSKVVVLEFTGSPGG